jgi:hypothetical protein
VRVGCWTAIAISDSIVGMNVCRYKAECLVVRAEVYSTVMSEL